MQNSATPPLAATARRTVIVKPRCYDSERLCENLISCSRDGLCPEAITDLQVSFGSNAARELGPRLSCWGLAM